MSNRNHPNLTYSERLKIEALHHHGLSAPQIAKELGRGVRTVYRELSRGLYDRLDGETYTWHRFYSADIGQEAYRRSASRRGAPLKIGKDFALASFLEQKIVNEKYSPGAALGAIQQQGLEFSVKVSRTTLYRYIDQHLFLELSNKHLPRGKRGKASGHGHRAHVANPLCRSISERSAPREEFGHWEMDTVIGQAGKQSCLLVLSERKTRYELVMKLEDKTARSVVSALDLVHRKCGKQFSRIFRTITSDNGPEFSDAQGIERAGRTTLYYCHPYSAWERGTNEHTNSLIRRHIPKGKSMNDISPKQIQAVQDWLNDYPRAIFNYQSARQRFVQELQKNHLSISFA